MTPCPCPICKLQRENRRLRTTMMECLAATELHVQTAPTNPYVDMRRLLISIDKMLQALREEDV